jgi:hypothetical protein
VGKLTEGKRLCGAIVVEEGHHTYSRFAKLVMSAYKPSLRCQGRASTLNHIARRQRVRALVSKDDRQFAAQTAEALAHRNPTCSNRKART